MNLAVTIFLLALTTTGISAELSWKNPETAYEITQAFQEWRASENKDPSTKGPTAYNPRMTGQPISNWLSPEELASLSKDHLILEGIKANALRIKDDVNEVHLKGLDKTFTFHPDDKVLVQELILRELLSNLDDNLRGDYPGSEVIDQLLDAIKDALNNNLKWLFSMLVKPVMKIAAALDPLPEYKTTTTVMDGDSPMKYIEQAMDNWGSTLANERNARIFYPETRIGIQNIIQMAAREGKRVRASGMRHTWNAWIWGVDDNSQNNARWGYSPKSQEDVDYFIAMVPNEVSDHLSYVRGNQDAWRERAKELAFVEGPLTTWIAPDGSEKAAVKVGAATLNQQLFEWILEDRQWTLPLDTIMLLMTYGGTTSPMCHGGGLQHKSLSDQVLAVEYIDSQGRIQVVDDPELLKMAGGSFGLLGIVVSLTLQMDKMTYARWGPQIIDIPMEEYLPRPGQDLPQELLNRFQDHYYAEWIAYPSHHLGALEPVVWQNVWDNQGKKEDAVELVSDVEENYEIAYEFLAEVASGLYKALLYEFQAEEYLYWLYGWMSGAASRLAMKDIDDPITTTVTEALHFQRGLHTLTVRAMELNIPIPDNGNGQPDWTIVQKSWWDCQDLIKEYESRGDYPVDYAMELRLMSGSDMFMAPYYGNKHGTVSIEVCSSALVPTKVWEDFKADLAFVWGKYKDFDGSPLKIRPHWAKELPVRVGTKDIGPYMDEVYSEQIPLFVGAFQKIVDQNGGNFTDTKLRFSTKDLDRFFENYW